LKEHTGKTITNSNLGFNNTLRTYLANMACGIALAMHWDDDERNVRTAINPWRRDMPTDVMMNVIPLLEVCRDIVKDSMDAKKHMFEEQSTVGYEDEDQDDDAESSSSTSGFLDANYCAKSFSLSIPSDECISDVCDMIGDNEVYENNDKDDNSPQVESTVHITPFFYT